MSDVKPVALDVARVHELISGYKEADKPASKQRARREIVAYFIAHDAALQAEIEALRKDAERYRWLRDQHEGLVLNGNDADGIMLAASVRALAFTVFMPDKWEHESLVPVPIGDLDEAVDAAIAKEKQQESLK